MPPKYSTEDLEQALKAVLENGFSLNEASRRYGIPKSTLHNKLHGKCTQKQGAPTALPPAIEERLVVMLKFFSKWRIPVTTTEFKDIIKEILDSSGFNCIRFKDNKPGRKWLDAFRKRHNLSLRFADNLKAGRAMVGKSTIDEYFNHLEASLEGVTAGSTFNYDETNLSDDPKKTKVLVPRGLSRVERKMEHSKTSTSIMFSSSASGEFLPPMVIYKGVILKEEWTVGGPPDYHFAMTKSGWFDRATFEEWFFQVFQKYVNDKNVPKPIGLIGDNLASHFSKKVIKLCNEIENDIRFIVLPSNSTNLTQPLDVGIFRGMKLRWRDLLMKYREEHPTGAILRTKFPSMLKALCQSTPKDTIISSFRCTGISPLNREEVLKRIPSTDNIDEESITKAFGAVVTKRLEKDISTEGPSKRRRDGVEPGKAILLHHLKKVSYEKDSIWYCCECNEKWTKND